MSDSINQDAQLAFDSFMNETFNTQEIDTMSTEAIENLRNIFLHGYMRGFGDAVAVTKMLINNAQKKGTD